MTDIEALAVEVGVLDEGYEWWCDWKTGVEMFAFMGGLYVFLVVGGCLGW